MIVLPDAGPLISLAGAGQLELLRRLYAKEVVPRVVYEEVTIAGEVLTGSAEVAAASWIHVVDRDSEPALAARLDRGEAAAIPLALEFGAVLLVDDSAAPEGALRPHLACHPTTMYAGLQSFTVEGGHELESRVGVLGGADCAGCRRWSHGGVFE